MNMHDPAHPGEFLWEEFMKPHGLSSNALAKAIGVTPARVNEIVRGKCGIMADTALRLARFFGTDAQSWMKLQDNYDLALAEREAGNLIRKLGSR